MSDLPAGWSTAQSRSDGATYYINDHTGESTFDKPTQPATAGPAPAPAPAAGQLPAGWRTQQSNSTGEWYYVNEYTGDSTYDVPTKPAVDPNAPWTPNQHASQSRQDGESSGGLFGCLGGSPKTPKPEPEPEPEPTVAPRKTNAEMTPAAALPGGLRVGAAVTSKIQLSLPNGKHLSVGTIGHVNGPAKVGGDDRVLVHFGKLGEDVEMFAYQFEAEPSAAQPKQEQAVAGGGGEAQRKAAAQSMAEVEQELREESGEPLPRHRTRKRRARRARDRVHHHSGGYSSDSGLRLSPRDSSDSESGSEGEGRRRRLEGAELLRSLASDGEQGAAGPRSPRERPKADFERPRGDGRRGTVRRESMARQREEARSRDVSGLWEVLTEDGRGRTQSFQLLLEQDPWGPALRTHSRSSARTAVLVGEAGDASEIDGEVVQRGRGRLELDFEQREIAPPHSVRYWRAEMLEGGGELRGVWATDETELPRSAPCILSASLCLTW